MALLYGGVLQEQEGITAREKERTRVLTEEEELERLRAKQRNKGLQGGGRTGLMFGNNQQGVV